MTNRRSLPHRMASPASAPARPPRLWPNLPAETRARIAGLLAELLRRRPSVEEPAAIEENGRADRQSC